MMAVLNSEKWAVTTLGSVPAGFFMASLAGPVLFLTPIQSSTERSRHRSDLLLRVDGLCKEFRCDKTGTKSRQIGSSSRWV